MRQNKIITELPIAYMSYLFKEGKGERKTIANLLLKDIYFHRGELSFQIVEMTGDITYNRETFLKAADLIIEEVNKK